MRRGRLWLGPVAVGALFVAAACGDVNADLEPDDAVATNSGTSGGFAGDASTLTLRSEPSVCPIIPPVPRYFGDGGEAPDIEAFDGSPNGLQVPDVCNGASTCEYGTSADRHCNSAFTCRNNEWAESPNVACYAGSCPGSDVATAQLEGRPCTLENDAGGVGGPEAEAICNVADGVCSCTTGSSGTDTHERRWACSAPLIRSCPLARPLIGAKCEGDTYCDYGACKAKRGIAIGCQDGYWQVVPPTCKN